MNFVISQHAVDQLKTRFNLAQNEIESIVHVRPQFVCNQCGLDELYKIKLLGYDIYLPCSREGDTRIVKTALFEDQAMSNVSQNKRLRKVFKPDNKHKPTVSVSTKKLKGMQPGEYMETRYFVLKEIEQFQKINPSEYDPAKPSADLLKQIATSLNMTVTEYLTMRWRNGI